MWLSLGANLLQFADSTIWDVEFHILFIVYFWFCRFIAGVFMCFDA
jgi:hypothetical protein